MLHHFLWMRGLRGLRLRNCVPLVQTDRHLLWGARNVREPSAVGAEHGTELRKFSATLTGLLEDRTPPTTLASAHKTQSLPCGFLQALAAFCPGILKVNMCLSTFSSQREKCPFWNLHGRNLPSKVPGYSVHLYPEWPVDVFQMQMSPLHGFVIRCPIHLDQSLTHHQQQHQHKTLLTLPLKDPFVSNTTFQGTASPLCSKLGSQGTALISSVNRQSELRGRITQGR